MAEFTFTTRFDVPESARKRAQQWINAGGGPNSLAEVFDGLDIKLTDTQVQSLYDSMDAESREVIDGLREEIANTRAGGRLQKVKKERLQRELVAKALGSEVRASGVNLDYNPKLSPRDMFPGKPRRNIPDALRATREYGDAIRSDQDRFAEKRTSDKAKQMEGVVDKDFLKQTLAPDSEKTPQGFYKSDGKPSGAKQPWDMNPEEKAQWEAQGKAWGEAADKSGDLTRQKMKALGLRILDGGKKGLKFLGAIPHPITAALGAAGLALDAKDAYALTESTMNPETEEERARQKALADLMRRNEVY